jgi:hypothetical protein
MRSIWVRSWKGFQGSKHMYERGEAARLIRDTLSQYKTGDEAEALVQEILKTDKATFDALHMLGTKEGSRAMMPERKSCFGTRW